MSKIMGSVMVCLALLAPAAARATESTPPAQAEISKRVGAGYKIGNGLGFVGADVIVNVVDHVALDVQGHWLSFDSGGGGTATGWGLGGELQLFWKKGHVSSPYLGLGLAHARLSLGDVT